LSESFAAVDAVGASSDERFRLSVAFVLKHEGGFVDHPADPGGATNFGITHKTLGAWRREPADAKAVKALTRKEAGEIYRAR
jgi:lysozyme family protein